MRDYTKCVNIKQGSRSSFRYSNGNTLPLVTAPFGMNNFCIQTQKSAEGWFFHPEHRQIEGIRLTHQPSPWMGDYGHFLVMPQNGDVYIKEDERASGYRPEEVSLSPHYMAVEFLRYNAKMQVVPTERCAMFEIDWEYKDIPRLAFIPFNYETKFNLDYKKRRLEGYTKALSGGASEDFKIYFSMEFNQKIDLENTMITQVDGTYKKGLDGKGIGLGINIAFEIPEGESLEVKLGTSFINSKQVKINLEREVGEKSLEELKSEGQKNWNNLLGSIDAEFNKEEELKTFYSCMYRSLIFPRVFHEYTKEGEAIHHITKTGEIGKGYMYTDNGFWDTHRTVYPLLSIIAPDRLSEILEGFINFYKEEGWLPRWISPGERGIMPGTLIDAVLADGAVKGIVSDEMLELFLEAMIKHATQKSNSPLNGRVGIEDYLKYGYLPRELYKESVNNTLDNAYGDFCIAQVADLLGKTDVVEEYMERSKNYKNVFDPVTGFSRGKDKNGKMKEDFNPLDWGGEYCEGSAWQNSFGVYHDMEGLAQLMGGKEELVKKMNELFNTPPLYRVGDYKKEIHEMTEMAAVDFGQCAISNQPSFHIPYIFAEMGEPKQSAYWVGRIMQELFNSSDQGFPGDEDNGTMAAWYIFSALGFYPFCPGKPKYTLGIPLIKKAKIKVGSSKITTINVVNNEGGNAVIKNVKINGESHFENHLNHQLLVGGSNIDIELKSN